MNSKDLSISKYSSNIVFITGGTKSGKSEFAEYLANEITSINKYFGAAQQKTVINYEKSQPSSIDNPVVCLLYTSPSPRDSDSSRMPSSA